MAKGTQMKASILMMISALLGVLTATGARAAHAQQTLKVTVTVAPDPMRYDTPAVAVVRSEPGAVCIVGVQYVDHTVPPSFAQKYGHNRPYTRPKSSRLTFAWREQTKSDAGFVVAGCATGARAGGSASAVFTVLH
jgi:hypothetical protein